LRTFVTGTLLRLGGAESPSASYVPTADQRALVENAAAFGITQADIAEQLKIDEKTLRTSRSASLWDARARSGKSVQPPFLVPQTEANATGGSSLADFPGRGLDETKKRP
jgi:hypothetical protein